MSYAKCKFCQSPLEHSFADLGISPLTNSYLKEQELQQMEPLIILKPQGIITMEFPHLLQLIQENQFDTIYHEHFYYLSFLTVEKIFKAAGLIIFDVEKIPTHGGSLRIYARHGEDDSKPVGISVGELLEKEDTFGLKDLQLYRSFTEKITTIKYDILDFSY